MIAARVPDATQSARSLLRAVVVVVLTAVALAAAGSDVLLPWHPTAEVGVSIDADENVLDVKPGSSAAREGIVAGDRIDMAATPFASRQYFEPGTQNSFRDGAHVPIVVVHHGHARRVVLVAALVPRSFADNATDLLLMASDVGLSLTCAFLVLKRPSRMTWAFFFYGVGALGVGVTTVANLPAVANAMLNVLIGLLSIQWLWLVLFALRFPGDDPAGWRGAVERALLVALPFAIVINVWGSTGYLFGVVPPQIVMNVLAFCQIFGLVFAALVFVLTYVHATAGDRARIRWVMLGLVVGFGGITIYVLGTSVPGIAVAWPIWLLNLAQAFQIFVPATVAYAVVRHRVFDVRFFIGRAVVYGALTTGVVATLTLIDYAAGKVLSGTGLAAIGEAGVAIVVGLSLNGVHKRFEQVVDRTLFRSRIDAQRRLRRVSRGLTHATTLEAIAGIVVHEPAEALSLASAAIFSRSPSGDYVRGASLGWDEAQLRSIDRDHPLVLQLLEISEPVPIGDITLPSGSLPAGLERPSFALPIRVRSELEAIVFYGPHESAEEIDPQELESIEQLLAAASGAFDHVRAETAHRRLQELEARLIPLSR